VGSVDGGEERFTTEDTESTEKKTEEERRRPGKREYNKMIYNFL